MVKKIIITGLVSVISTASFAGKQIVLDHVPSTHHSGSSYIGAAVGVGSPNAVTGSVFAGYGKKVGKDERFYLGGEVTGSVTSGYTFNNYRYGSTRHTYNPSLGASFIPGVMLTPTLMAYGRIGANVTHFSHGDNYPAAQLGLGLQKQINPNWAVRGEYVASSGDGFRQRGLPASGQANLGLVYKFDE